MKALLVSFTESTNIGDQLIVKSLENFLEKKMEVVKYSYGLKKGNIELKKNNESNSLEKSYIRNLYAENLRKTYVFDNAHRYLNNAKAKYNPYWKEFLKDLNTSDVLVLGGGNAIFDLTANSLAAYKTNLLIEKAKELNKKIFVLSVGIGPFITRKQIEYTKKTLNKCDYVTFRDEKSLNYFIEDEKQKHNMHLSIDPVFLLEKRNNKMVKSKKTIGICIIDYRLNKANESQYTKYVNDFSKLIENIINRTEYSVVLFSTEIRDYQGVKDVYSLLANKEKVRMDTINTAEELLDLYESFDLVLGTRMHSMIVALSQYIPVVGLSWQQKVSEMFKILDDDESVFDIEQIDLYMDKIIEACNKKLENISKEKERLIDFKNKAKMKFEINNKILIKLNNNMHSC